MQAAAPALRGSSGSSGSSSGSGSGGGSSGAASDAAVPSQAGNPDGSCTAGVPAQGQPADTSNPTTVVGAGTAASCTFTALKHAVTAGGVDHLQLRRRRSRSRSPRRSNVPHDKDTVIDGGNKVTLDGGGASADHELRQRRIFSQRAPADAPAHRADQRKDDAGTGRSRRRRRRARRAGTTAKAARCSCATATSPSSTAIFTDNQAAPLGPDTGGGAIYVQGSKHGAVIVGSTFQQQPGEQRGGGRRALLRARHLQQPVLRKHGRRQRRQQQRPEQVLGDEQRPERDRLGRQRRRDLQRRQLGERRCFAATRSSTTRRAWARSAAGCSSRATTCRATLSIIDTTMTGNTGGSWTNVATGSMKNAGTAVGTNATASPSRTRPSSERAGVSAARCPWAPPPRTRAR